MARVVHMSVRSRYRVLLLCSLVSLVYFFLLLLRVGDDTATTTITNKTRWRNWLNPQPLVTTSNNIKPQVAPEVLANDFFSWSSPDHIPGPKPPYKPPREPSLPVPDPFPMLSWHLKASKLQHLLQPPAVNRLPTPHYPEDTPLFIGFTRNWPQLIQCVASYIAAGWPPSDIYVVENTGVMHSNLLNQLTLQNPFYLNHTQLGMLGVNVIITPTLLTFAQLQNFYAYTALENNWTEYFWSHQDVVVFSYENNDTQQQQQQQQQSLYAGAVSVLQYLRRPGSGAPRWANHFFAYDHLTLVNRDAILHVGGWDTHIPFYATDCDMYVRLMWAGYWQGETDVGIILDVATVLDDVAALFRVPGVRAGFQGDPGEFVEKKKMGLRTKSKQKRMRIFKGGREVQSHNEDDDYDYDDDDDDDDDDDHPKKQARRRKRETWEHLVQVAKRMEAAKYEDGNGWRNMWQLRQTGGQGEPFARDPEGFETGLRMMIDTGRSVFAEKWGHRGCDIANMNIKAEDAWQLERDWDPETEGMGFEGDEW